MFSIDPFSTFLQSFQLDKCPYIFIELCLFCANIQFMTSLNEVLGEGGYFSKI